MHTHGIHSGITPSQLTPVVPKDPQAPTDFVLSSTDPDGANSRAGVAPAENDRVVLQDEETPASSTETASSEIPATIYNRSGVLKAPSQSGSRFRASA